MNPLPALLLISSITGGTDILLEAENAELTGVFVDTIRAGYSGTGYVTGFDDTADSLHFFVETDDLLYAVFMASGQSSRIRQFHVSIDGETFSGNLIGAGGFRERRVAEKRLSAGEHIIAVHATGVDVDYLRLSPAAYDPPVRPPGVLTDPDASPATQALFDFLLDEYGRHILSGQQTLADVEYIRQVTGKSPAVGVFDLIDYSPSRIEHGARPNPSSEDWIDWAAFDGLVSLSWHWNAPTDLVDSSSQPWWRGFYTEATTFDVEAALADTTSERYQLLLRDIDAIAAQLSKFRAADVPVLWRPLHEAWGGWFWWGARGPDPFKELWMLLYDRLVRVHGMHNLIWVYTHDDPGWYPGDSYVDIVSRDVYSSEPDDMMRDIWDSMQAEFGGRKLVALSESGTLPDPDAIVDFGIWWSWFSVWTGSFIRDIPAAYLRHVFASDNVLTRDELPDWRSGTLTVESPNPDESGLLALYPNPTRGSSTIRLNLSVAADPVMEIYDLLGRVVRRTRPGFRSPGIIDLPIDAGLAAGVYLVRVTAPAFDVSGQLVVAR